jgi:hypothetical protein
MDDSPCQVRAANRQRACEEVEQQAANHTLTLHDCESEKDDQEEVGQVAVLLSFATPSSSSQPTISTLSTEEDEGEELLPLKSVFHCQYIHTKIVNDGKEGWECG